MDDMTQIPGQATGTPHDASALDRFFGWLRSLDLRRDTEDKWLAGVCSGIATRLGVDPIVIRAGLIVLVLLGGVGITVYLIAWAFIPNEREEIIAERALRHGDVWGIVLLVFVALSLFGGSGFADQGWGLWWVWWIAVPIGLVVWLVTRRSDSGRSSYAPAAPPYGTPPHAGDTTTGASHQAQPPYAAPASYSATQTSSAPPAYGPQPPVYGEAPLGGQPVGSGQPPYGPPPVARTRRPRPPKPPRRRGGGFLGAVLVGGLALATYGLMLWAHDTFSWSGSDEVVALAAALGVAGLGVLVMGLAGRRAGLTGFLAIVLALVTWSASVVPDVNVHGGIGDRTWRPNAVATDQRYRLGFGSATLNLSDYPTGQVPPPEMDAGVGVGELRLLVPSDLTVEVRSKVGIGDITGDVQRPLSTDQGPDGNREISTVEVIGTGDPELIVNANVGIGQIVVLGRE